MGFALGAIPLPLPAKKTLLLDCLIFCAQSIFNKNSWINIFIANFSFGLLTKSAQNISINLLSRTAMFSKGQMDGNAHYLRAHVRHSWTSTNPLVKIRDRKTMILWNPISCILESGRGGGQRNFVTTFYNLIIFLCVF